MIFKNYEYFLAIAECKNITRAAEKLFISQPALSKYLIRLEKNLNVVLFDHSNLPLQLTAAGLCYLAYIKEFQALEQRLIKDIFDTKNNIRIKIVLGISQWRASFVLPNVLPAYKLRFPYVDIELREGPQDVLVRLLESNKVDFCLMNSPAHNKHIVFEEIINERILLAVNADNPIISNHGLSSDFSSSNIQHFNIVKAVDQAYIILTSGQNLSLYTRAFLDRNDIHPKEIFETQNMGTALELVAAGMGITFVPEIGVRLKNFPSNMTFFTVGEPEFSWKFGIAYRRNTQINDFVRGLMSSISSYIRMSL